jgi:hypothetical protein
LDTLAGREVFSGTHMSRRKTDFTLFRRYGGETLRGFYTPFAPREEVIGKGRDPWKKRKK